MHTLERNIIREHSLISTPSSVIKIGWDVSYKCVRLTKISVSSSFALNISYIGIRKEEEENKIDLEFH